MTKSFTKTLPNPDNVFCPSNIPMRRAVLAHIDALHTDKHGTHIAAPSIVKSADLTPNLLPLRRAVMAHIRRFKEAKAV